MNVGDNITRTFGKKITLLSILLVLMILVIGKTVYGQNKNENSKAFQILDKAMGGYFEKNNIAIYFEGIAYSIDQPLKIFGLPAYEVVRGGFLLTDDKKMEMQLGTMKSLSDGKLMVVVDEISKTMYIDSIRTTPLIDSSGTPDIEKLLDETFGEGTLSYEGEEIVNGKKCYKIKSDFNNADRDHVYYWVDIQTSQLYLMAEWQNNAYDVYWFRSVGKAPKNHDYSVNLPNRELETYYGYNVIDNRYIREQMNAKGAD